MLGGSCMDIIERPRCGDGWVVNSVVPVGNTRRHPPHRTHDATRAPCRRLWRSCGEELWRLGVAADLNHQVGLAFVTLCCTSKSCAASRPKACRSSFTTGGATARTARSLALSCIVVCSLQPAINVCVCVRARVTVPTLDPWFKPVWFKVPCGSCFHRAARHGGSIQGGLPHPCFFS